MQITIFSVKAHKNHSWTYTSGRTSLSFAVIARISEEQHFTNVEGISSLVGRGCKQEGRRERERKREELKEGEGQSDIGRTGRRGG